MENGGADRHDIDIFLEKIRRALWVFKAKRIGLLGLAFDGMEALGFEYRSFGGPR